MCLVGLKQAAWWMHLMVDYGIVKLSTKEYTIVRADCADISWKRSRITWNWRKVLKTPRKNPKPPKTGQWYCNSGRQWRNIWLTTHRFIFVLNCTWSLQNTTPPVIKYVAQSMKRSIKTLNLARILGKIEVTTCYFFLFFTPFGSTYTILYISPISLHM